MSELIQYEIGTRVDDAVPNQTSSIGSLGKEPKKASFKRWKTFNNDKIQGYKDFLDWYKKIQDFKLEHDERITVRSVVKKFALANFLDSHENRTLIEGVIDLSGNGVKELNDCVIVYLGKNGSDREVLQRAEICSQLAEVKEIFSRSHPVTRELPENTEHVLMENGRVKDKNQNDVIQIIDQYKQLLRAFGWNEEDADELIRNSKIDLILSTDLNSEQVVLGAGLAEWAEVDINGNILKIVELTEAVVHPLTRGLGIYHAITEIQMRRVFQEGANLVYGESNLSSESRGVIYVASKNGRKPANIWEYNGKIYELENALVAHVPAGGEGLSSFVPTYITREVYEEVYDAIQSREG